MATGLCMACPRRAVQVVAGSPWCAACASGVRARLVALGDVVAPLPAWEPWEAPGAREGWDPWEAEPMFPDGVRGRAPLWRWSVLRGRPGQWLLVAVLAVLAAAAPGPVVLLLAAAGAGAAALLVARRAARRGPG